MVAPAAVQTKTPERRVDPRPRPMDGAGWFRVVDSSKDPDKFYCWVDIASGQVDDYASIGYEPCKWGGPGTGVQVTGGKLARKAGEDIVCRGQMLMCIPKADKARIEKEGAFGGSGQDECNRIERLIIRKRGNRDYFRAVGGMEGSLDNGQCMDVEAHVSSPFVEEVRTPRGVMTI